MPEAAICLVCTAVSVCLFHDFSTNLNLQIKFVLDQMAKKDYNPGVEFSADACAQDYLKFVKSFKQLRSRSSAKYMTTLSHVFAIAR